MLFTSIKVHQMYYFCFAQTNSKDIFLCPPPLSGGIGLDSRSSGCARLGGGVGPPLGVVVEEVGF